MCARKNYATLEIHPYRNRAEITLLMCELYSLSLYGFVPAQELPAIMSTLPYNHNENDDTYCDHGRFLSSIRIIRSREKCVYRFIT